MIRGIYAAASGMIAESVRNDVIANNLANVNTAGFKKDVAVTKDFASMLIWRINDGVPAVVGSLGVGTLVDETATIHTAGSARHTGNTLDLALEGKGFFTVETPQGIRYTRNGTFTLNAGGELVTSEGHRVLGQNGPIRVAGGASLSFAQDGRITAGGVETDRLQITVFEDEGQLVKEGASLFTAPAGAGRQPFTGLVRQGFLEQPNVNAVAEMVNLIAGFRAYEVNAKTVQAHDQLLEKAVTEVGRI